MQQDSMKLTEDMTRAINKMASDKQTRQILMEAFGMIGLNLQRTIDKRLEEQDQKIEDRDNGTAKAIEEIAAKINEIADFLQEMMKGEVKPESPLAKMQEEIEELQNKVYWLGEGLKSLSKPSAPRLPN